MENQHRKIKGYRELNEAEILQMNNIKGVGETLETLVTSLERTVGVDRRWVAIGKTHMQEGLMALVRSVAKPESF